MSQQYSQPLYQQNYGEHQAPQRAPPPPPKQSNSQLPPIEMTNNKPKKLKFQKDLLKML